MRKIIAFIGRAGSGKDYQCSLLQEQGYQKVAFADILRKMTAYLLGYNYKTFLEKYDYLKQHQFFNRLTVRNILERLSDIIKKSDADFFVKEMITVLESSELKDKNICISDLRYIKEFNWVYNLCKRNNYEFKLIFCDYHSDRYQEENSHESAWLSNKLYEKGFKDLQEVTCNDINLIEGLEACK